MMDEINQAVADLEAIGFQILRRIRQPQPVTRINVFIERQQIRKIFGPKDATRYPTVIEFTKEDGTLGTFDLGTRKELWSVSVASRTS